MQIFPAVITAKCCAMYGIHNTNIHKNPIINCKANFLIQKSFDELLIWKHSTSTKTLIANLEFANSRAMLACVTTWFTYQHVCMIAWFTYQRACVPACQKRPKFSFLLANVPIKVPTCKTSCQFFKHSSHEMLREIPILYYYIQNSTLYSIS